ncbi:MAG: siphovirus Gp157 family protein [Acidobacteriaceae bacterium]
MATISSTSAENSSLFEIDQELEAAFEAATQEEEQTGEIGEETRQHCLALFAELGKKVDRIAAYVRATEFKARAAKEEAARLSARQKSAENRVLQVKSMLAYYLQTRGLKRLEGQLNTVRLQKNIQTSLRLDPFMLPHDYQQATITIPQPDWERALALIPIAELRQKLESAVVVGPNKELIRQDLQAGKQISGAELFKGEHIRFE